MPPPLSTIFISLLTGCPPPFESVGGSSSALYTNSHSIDSAIITEVTPNVQLVPRRVYIEPTNTGPNTLDRLPAPVIIPIQVPCKLRYN